MAWQTIVVGVDPSEAGVAAARAGWELAQAAGTSCQLVHAVRDVWASGRVGMADTSALLLEIERASRQALEEALRGQVPDALVDTLEVRTGSATAVLRDVAAELHADLVVLGGKRHSTVARWLGGSTAKNAVRGLDRPVLVATGPARFARILVALDLSDAAAATLAAAERFAGLCGASLRVLHAVEPIPYAAEGITVVDTNAMAEEAERAFRRTVADKVTHPGAEVVIRRGPAATLIEEEAVTWPADLLVVGAHGRTRVERLLLGSVSESLVNALPTSVLVVRERG